jgi:hypothetical protein
LDLTTLALLVIILLVVFGFVLEPVLRARRDQVTLDSAALPERLPDFLLDDDEDDDRREEFEGERPAVHPMNDPSRAESNS